MYLVYAPHREEKQLVVVTEDGEETIISYEYLVFATGLQYCVEEGQDGQVPPSNVCALNDSEDEELIKECLDNLSRGAGTCISVYIYKYCTIQCTFCAMHTVFVCTMYVLIHTLYICIVCTYCTYVCTLKHTHNLHD